MYFYKFFISYLNYYIYFSKIFLNVKFTFYFYIYIKIYNILSVISYILINKFLKNLYAEFEI